MDIGVWMSLEVLAHKLAAQRESNPEQAWNLARWPSRLSGEGQNRLFVATVGAWRGFFVLADDFLYNPQDARAPYALLFDTRTWTAIEPVPARRGRGFTYDVPSNPSPAAAPASPPTTPAKRARRPSFAIRAHRH